MYEQLRLKEMRRAYSVQGWALLIYYGIMNVAVMLVMFVDSIIKTMPAALSGQEPDMEQLTEGVADNSAWGYFLAIGIGLLILLLWKKPKFCFHTLWKKGKPLKIRSFFGIFVIFISSQLLVQVMAILLEIILNQFGMSLMELMESASGDTDTLGMFLYVGVGAPIVEEIIFRGLVLRSLEPYGKKFAIFASALLFGLYHGNIIQIPFAFGVGLVLGYVTVEYNMIWAMILHMFNNLILSDTLVRLTEHLPAPWNDLVFWLFIVGCSIAALVVLLVKRQDIKAYWNAYRDDPQCAKAFWSAPGIITLVSVLGVMTVFTMVALMMV
jgi:membrane protease YdiL (CAAX protease family)